MHKIYASVSSSEPFLNIACLHVANRCFYWLVFGKLKEWVTQGEETVLLFLGGIQEKAQHCRVKLLCCAFCFIYDIFTLYLLQLM